MEACQVSDKASFRTEARMGTQNLLKDFDDPRKQHLVVITPNRLHHEEGYRRLSSIYFFFMLCLMVQTYSPRYYFEFRNTRG